MDVRQTLNALLGNVTKTWNKVTQAAHDYRQGQAGVLPRMKPDALSLSA